jgi:hypothetical protein
MKIVDHPAHPAATTRAGSKQMPSDAVADLLRLLQTIKSRSRHKVAGSSEVRARVQQVLAALSAKNGQDPN